MKDKKLSIKTWIKFVVSIGLAAIVVFYVACLTRKAKDWTTYRHDITRSGITTEELTAPLALRWTFKPTHAPKPAWPKPGEEMERSHFDSAYHVTVARGIVYFGSSVDNKVYALNARTGQIKWAFFTEGPVRFAPTIWKNRVYAGSDDGYVYCLSAKTGKLIWKYRPGPGGEKLLGNGRMISLWPVRTSILIDDGTVYFGAGVFPYEGVYICALDARDGSIIWKNDTTGDRAHELAYGGISPQSYLIASKNILYVPSGRAMPAAFGRKSGQFLYYLLPGAKVGGTWALLDKGNLVAGVDHSGSPAKRAYDEQTGKGKSYMDDMHAWFPGTDLVVTSDVSYTVSENGLFALDREKYLVIRGRELNVLAEKRQVLRNRLSDVRKKIFEVEKEEEIEEEEEKIKNPIIENIEKKLFDLAEEEKQLKATLCRWEYLNENLSSLILAGDKVFAGGKGIIVCVEAQTGKELWKSEVQGKAQGLAVANGNLFVSTDNGNIYCFGEGRIPRAKEVSPPINPSPYRNDRLSPIYSSTAEKIMNETGIKKGYCLVLGCGTGRLAFELSKQSELKIIGIEKDKKKTASAKKRLDAAGLYGSRVVVEQWDLSTLPDYFADLIVSEEMMTSGEIDASPEEMFRVLKPYGGKAYFGQPVEISKETKSLEKQDLLGWLRQSGAAEPEVTKDNGIWAKVTRGKLEGSGSWTGQYGNPQNTACSMDQLVKGPLGVLWFGEPGPEKMVERHSKAASPVSINGRLFIQGEEVIMAYNAFNGTLLWEREIPGAVRPRADVDGGNLVATEDNLYVAAHDKCYCLNPATGETIRVLEIPSSHDGSSHRWGYVSFTDNTLYGSRAVPLNNDYFALREILIDNGRWKNIKDIPPEYREEYGEEFEELVSRYPVPDERLWEYFKRSGTLWRFMADFPDWEIYESSKGALSENVMLSDMVFAMNPETGKLLWKHQGNQIAHITVSIGEGKIFFSDNKVTNFQKKRALGYRQELIRKGIYEESRVLKEEEKLSFEDVQKLVKKGLYEKSEIEKFSFEDADVRNVFCFDAATGKMLWEKTLDFTGCGGDTMGTAYHDEVLLFFGNMGDHDAWRFQNGSLRWRRLTALSAKTGEVLWSRPINYRTRPVLVGDQIFIEPRACDLHTGVIKMRSHPITGEKVPWEYLRPGHTCAVSSASAHALFYRSYSTAIYDFSEDRGLVLFGGIRPGCWINLIPANGLLLFPEASSGCTCSFPLRCSIVFKHKEERVQPWTVFITHGAKTPAKHFAINLGAPSDMKDEKGQIWFGYPNPKTDYEGNHFPNYGVKFDLHENILLGMGYFCSDFKNRTVEGSDKPWLFTSGCIGLTRCEVPLLDDMWGDKPCVYTLRLGFYASSNDRIGQRVFDIKLQGESVLTNFDVFKEAGIPDKAVIKEFKGIKVQNILTIELSSNEKNSTIDQAPIINFIEVIREDVDEGLKGKKPVRPITRGFAETLLQEAKAELDKKKFDKALEMYHRVFDASSSINLKQRALEGMSTIGSAESLSRITRFCRDTEPILWNYKRPSPILKNSATKVLIAVANNTTKTDKQKAIKMLNYALTIANFESRKKIVGSLKKLGVEIYGVPGK
ncbi:MAG: PQQ-binding-like beta-propeller repeat protein [Candidatus Aminicenantaceae bacterium]